MYPALEISGDDCTEKSDHENSSNMNDSQRVIPD